MPIFSKQFLANSILLTALLAPTVEATSLHLIDDAFINLNQPSRNTGFWQNVRIRDTENTIEQGFVRFSLATLPDNLIGADIELATLKLWVGNLNRAGAISLHRVLGDWDESTLTATNAPPIDSAFATIAVDREDKNNYITVDVTGAVRDWVDQTTSNDGLAILPSDTNIAINSKENRTTSHSPEIKLVLVGPTGPRGEPGPAGPSAGSTIRIIRSEQTAIRANGGAGIRLVCASNELAINGGFYLLGHDQISNFTPFIDRFRYISNGPVDGDRQWITLIRNESDDPGSGFFYIYCQRR